MAVQGGAEEDVYATLLLSDTYLPGALVLAHSLRDAGTSKKLAVLVTLDSVSADVITQLKTLYDYVIPVGRIRNLQPANLHLMNRADLHSAFTKITLWKQTQFRKIVYIDCDVVAYRAPDELFDISQPFSAAPDIGWPDLFNTGVMVLTPNLGDYYAMIAMAERNISFDGADQGLINMHFGNNYNRLSFAYNVTPSGHYQYVPAYRHFQSGISMVHFIGPEKPWFKGRRTSTGSAPYDEMTGRWWAVYDRHYRVPTPTSTPRRSALAGSTTTSTTGTPTTASSGTTQPALELVQYFTKGEYQPKATHTQTTGELYSGVSGDPHPPSVSYSHEHGHRELSHSHDGPQGHDHYDHGAHQHHGHVEAPSEATAPQPDPSASFKASSFYSNVEGIHTEARKEQVLEPSHGAPPPKDEAEQKPPFQPTMSNWDAQKESPPVDSKPEAMNFPDTTYEMSHDSTPFVAPERYPSPPRNMWYEVPKEPPAPPSELPKPIFPWETERAPPSRVFPDDRSQKSESDGSGSETPTGGPWSASEHQPSTESSVTESSTIEQKSEPATPTIHITPSDPWSSFTLTNAWDEVPEIERYVDKIQKHKRTRSLKSPGVLALPGFSEEAEIAWRRRGSKLTDFPSEAERPSLPVTPAPIRRPKFWVGGPNVGYGADETPSLPAAEGVPGQTEWVCVHGIRWSPADCLCDLTNVLRYHKDPVAQLQKLARQQSEALLRKLGGGGGRDSSDLPSRPLPFGSEELISPTYVVQSANVLSPQPVKGDIGSSAVHSIESNLKETPRTTSTQSTAIPDTTIIPEPSYAGPGAAFEKGENIPTEDAPTLRIATVGLGTPTRSTGIPEPSYSGPGPAFEKDRISLEEDVD